jgi:hypothetical protein
MTRLELLLFSEVSVLFFSKFDFKNAIQEDVRLCCFCLAMKIKIDIYKINTVEPLLKPYPKSEEN